MAPRSSSQLFRYAGVGAIGTVAQFAVLVALVQLFGTDAVAASTAGALVGALVNYTLNYRYTFASRRMHRIALPRFLAVAGAGVLLNAAVLAAMLSFARVHYLVAQVVATSAVLIAGFAVNRKWTF